MNTKNQSKRVARTSSEAASMYSTTLKEHGGAVVREPHVNRRHFADEPRPRRAQKDDRAWRRVRKESLRATREAELRSLLEKRREEYRRVAADSRGAPAVKGFFARLRKAFGLSRGQ